MVRLNTYESICGGLGCGLGVAPWVLSNSTKTCGLAKGVAFTNLFCFTQAVKLAISHCLCCWFLATAMALPLDSRTPSNLDPLPAVRSSVYYFNLKTYHKTSQTSSDLGINFNKASFKVISLAPPNTFSHSCARVQWCSCGKGTTLFSAICKSIYHHHHIHLRLPRRHGQRSCPHECQGQNKQTNKQTNNWHDTSKWQVWKQGTDSNILL